MAMQDINKDWHADRGLAPGSGERLVLGIVATALALVIAIALYGAATGVTPDMSGAAGSDEWHGNVAASGWEG